MASRSADETRRAFDPRYPPEFQRGFGGVSPLRIAEATPADEPRVDVAPVDPSPTPVSSAEEPPVAAPPAPTQDPASAPAPTSGASGSDPTDAEAHLA